MAITVKIGGRDFPLAFTLDTICTLEKSVDNFSIGEIDKVIATNGGMLAVLHALAETGAKMEQATLDVSREWMSLHITPTAKRMIYLRLKITDAIYEGMNMESGADDDAEIDAVLEELKKKGN